MRPDSLATVAERMREYLTEFSQAVGDGRSDYLFGSPMGVVIAQGAGPHGHRLGTLPDGVAPMAAGDCFYNASTLMIASHGRFTFVEGYAMTEGLFPMQHAWCRTREGQIVDPTWTANHEGEAAAYWGIAFSPRFLAKRWAESPEPSVLASDFARGHRAIRDGFAFEDGLAVNYGSETH